jgi:hypothetical protein
MHSSDSAKQLESTLERFSSQSGLNVSSEFKDMFIGILENADDFKDKANAFSFFIDYMLLKFSDHQKNLKKQSSEMVILSSPELSSPVNSQPVVIPAKADPTKPVDQIEAINNVIIGNKKEPISIESVFNGYDFTQNIIKKDIVSDLYDPIKELLENGVKLKEITAAFLEHGIDFNGNQLSPYLYQERQRRSKRSLNPI